MSCALTQGLTIDCRDQVGGVNVFYAAEWSALTFTMTTGAISGIAKTSGKQFYKYELPKQVAEAMEELQPSEENGTLFYKQTFNFPINKLTKSVRDELHLLAKNKLALVWVDNNGNAWLFGYQGGMFLTANKAASGKAFGDRSGHECTLEAAEFIPAPSVQASVIATLLTPGT